MIQIQKSNPRILLSGVIILWALIGQVPLFSQSKNIKEAQSLLENQNYQGALRALTNELPSQNPEILFILAQCQFHLNQLDEAESSLSSVLTVRSTNPEAWFLQASIDHHQFQFSDAIDHYKHYLVEAKLDESTRADIKHRIKQCAYGIKSTLKDELGYSENLGPAINTMYDEIKPIVSANVADRIYFTSNRIVSGWDERAAIPYDDFGIYQVDYNPNGWSGVEPLSHLNSDHYHEKLLDIHRSGQMALFTRMDNQILVDTFSQQGHVRQGSFSLSKRIPGPILDPYWLSENIVLFSAELEEGLGGYDLYIAFRNQQGEWTHWKNLGPEVNTAYDEISPSFASNYQEIFFSSNRPEGLGGYDVFATHFELTTLSWSHATNLFTPVNSAGDDLDFRMGYSGNTAYLGSDRKSGLGGFDLYAFYFKEPPNLTDTVPWSAFEEWAEIIEEEHVINANRDELLVTVEVPYLLYDENDFILDPINIKSLEDLIVLLKELPESTLQIICHADDRQPFDSDLFFSIKRAEKIKAYLMEQGISQQRMQCMGAGKKFPIAKNQINGVSNPSGQKFNRRIEFRIHHTSDRHELIYPLPDPVSQFRDSTYQRFNDLTNGLHYKVFVYSGNRPMLPQELQAYPDLTVEQPVSGQAYEYTVGNETVYFKANLLKNSLRESGFTAATVVAYVDGRRIPESEIDDYINEYPDLIYYQYRSE